MAGSGKQPPPSSARPVPPGSARPQASPPVRRLPQVLMLKKDEPNAGGQDAAPGVTAASGSPAAAPAPTAPAAPPAPAPSAQGSDEDRFGMGSLEGLSMADLLGPDPGSRRSSQAGAPPRAAAAVSRSVDDFDFDEEAFLAALDEQEFVGSAGEVVRGTVVGLEGDGVYVDIGGKAPGFMPKKESGLGVITSLKERFPMGMEVEVLVTREQNADGMVTVSARALALRQSWETVRAMEKEGRVVQVKVNGFNRGGVTCDLEGLRGFVPRSQLVEGDNHEALVGRTLGVTFLEVNPDTRKLVLSEKREASNAPFS
jgi:small subunit ribosomal protein S1